MRLLKVGSDGELSLAEFVGNNVPPYAILSHTWGKDCDEVTFQDMVEGKGKDKLGYKKLRFCEKQNASEDLQFFWVDTCCIDKTSSAELSEAINSMYRWYHNAEKCYVYLSDVSINGSVEGTLSSQQTWETAFGQSRWFTRGWTLQELVAPTCVEFFSLEGERLGDRESMVREIEEITGISMEALQGCPLSRFGFEERMSWARGRDTKREEDAAYSLLGIFGVHMPLVYGEGRRNAFIRLQREIQDASRNIGTDGFGFVLQVGTALHEIDDTFRCLMGDMNGNGWPDLVAVKSSGTSSNSIEVNILSGASRFRKFIRQTGTGLHETPAAQYDFALADWDGDKTLDLVVIKKSGTETKTTEVCILSGASNFQNIILQTGTALHETDDTWAFTMGNWNAGRRPDLFAIKKSNTGTNSTEVHILSGASGFQKFILQTGTPFHETNAGFDFAVADWNADGCPDLVVVGKSDDSSRCSLVHVLSGASNYQDFHLHAELPLYETLGMYEFMVAEWTRNGRLDLVGIRKSKTGTHSTEVHIMSS
ncbi:related to beta transducin-like protein [Fusarium torulosum]|uniref:Related to beta transducin-like protein n=1 Tax=Fusarium torulosum TaxID=33205 RepID=A0AAE8SPV5_9HYPO|nr:related to beta transducin-like protein [Fusarium torulosum]